MLSAYVCTYTYYNGYYCYYTNSVDGGQIAGIIFGCIFIIIAIIVCVRKAQQRQ